MKTENVAESKPPYVAYKTFANFIKSFRASGIPDRIDRSVFPGMSGAAQSFLLASLRFLGFITNDGSPTAVLRDLIDNPQNEKAALAKAAKEKYSFIFNSGFNIAGATGAQLTEKFKEQGLNGSTIVKAISFFTSLCDSAGIAISPHLKGSRPANGAGNATPRRYTKRRKPLEDEQGGNGGGSPPNSLAPVKTFQEILLSKFPDFNPAWDAETQKKWFDNFETFMKSVKSADPAT